MPRVFTWPRDWMPFVKASSFALSPANVSASGMFSGVRRAALIRQVWIAKFTLDRSEQAIWREWQAFRDKLDGINGVVKLFDPFRTHPLGIAAGLNEANKDGVAPGERWSDGTLFSDGTGWRTGSRFARVGADQTAGFDSVKIDGLTASQASALRAGDMIQIGDYLYQVVETVASDASGSARAEIRPRLRAGIALNDPIVLVEAQGLFAFAGDDEGQVERYRPLYGNPAALGTFGATFVEYIPN